MQEEAYYAEYEAGGMRWTKILYALSDEKAYELLKTHLTVCGGVLISDSMRVVFKNQRKVADPPWTVPALQEAAQ